VIAPWKKKLKATDERF